MGGRYEGKQAGKGTALPACSIQHWDVRFDVLSRCVPCAFMRQSFCVPEESAQSQPCGGTTASACLQKESSRKGEEAG